MPLWSIRRPALAHPSLDYAGKARERRIPRGQIGLVTVLQRAGSSLNVNLHFHTLALDGVFTTERADGALAFHPVPGPTDAEVMQNLATILYRVRRLLVRRGLDSVDTGAGPDQLAEASPVLAGIVSASLQGRVALGLHAGARVRRLGVGSDTEAVTTRGRRHAHLDGFDLHANVWVAARDRAGLERLCRYVLRPPFAQEHVRLRDDGRVLLELKARGTMVLVNSCSSRRNSSRSSRP